MNYDAVAAQSDDRDMGDTPLHNRIASQPRDKAGLAIAFDALQEELNTQADLVSNLFHRLDPILMQESNITADKIDGIPGGGSSVQQLVWEKTAMVARCNSQLRDLTSRIDV